MADQEQTAETRPFTQFLHEQRRGVLHAELGEALADVCAAVVKTGKTGEVILSLKIKPSGDMIAVTDSVTTKVPQGERAPSMYWVDGRGNATRFNPQQPELPLQQVREAV